MAATSSSNPKPHGHARSVSLPSTLDQQSIFNAFCERLQAPKETSTSGSSSLIVRKLNRLNEMYESMKPLLTLPTTQQSLAQGFHKELLNKLLDELVGLLDLCSTTKDVLSMSMDSAKQLQSSFRRKRGNQLELVSAVEEYLSHRRKVKKTVLKALPGLQKQHSCSINEDGRIPSNINILKEMRLNTLRVFESLLSYILGSKAQVNENRWSLVSKMVGHKRVQCNQENEVKMVDDDLHILIDGYKKTKSVGSDVNAIQMGLADVELHLVDLEEQVDRLCRHLIKTRVSILNILNF